MVSYRLGPAARRRLAWLLAALLWLPAAACGGPDAGPRTVMVFAAASLSASFAAIGREFEARNPGTKVELHFAGTPQLVVQVREGAPADVFASADAENLQQLVDAGQTASPPRVFARNTLAIVTARGNPKGIRALADLARADLRVLLCGPGVPAGRYARQALAKAAIAVQSRSDEPNVQAVVGKVRLGEADAGIVYATDVASVAEVTVVPVAAAHDVVASYPIAVLATGRNPAAAEQFVAFVLGADGQRILQAGGFLPP